MKNKFLKNIAFGSFLLGSFAGTFSQLQAGPLHDAVADNDIAAVRRLILENADLNEIHNKFGATPLQFSATAEMIKLLLGAGADINKQNRWGDTPLHSFVSIYNPDLDCVEILLENGAKVDIKNKRGDTPRSMVQRAIEWGIVCNGRPGATSASIGYEERETYRKVLELFENRGGKAEVYQLPDADTSLSGVEPESMSSQYMPGKVVLKVVKPESTPLQHTPEKVVPEVVEPKSMPSQHTPNSTPGGSVWQSLRPVRQSESERLALPKPSFAGVGGKKSKKSKKSNQGRNLPTKIDQQQAMTGINQRDNYGNTSLHNAVSTKNPNLGLIEALLKMGARIDVKNKKGATPWSMVWQAANSKDDEIRKRYIEVLELFKNPPRPRNATVEKNREKSQLQRKRSKKQSFSLLH